MSKSPLQLPANDTPTQDSSFWWIKLQEIQTARRGTMYRFISTSLQLLLIGNAAGVGLILGIFPSGAEPAGIHWICLTAILSFMLGILAAGATLFFVTVLTIKEAHAIETSSRYLLDKKFTWEQAILYIDDSCFRIASLATISGILSISLLIIGALVGVYLLALYY